MIFETFPVGMLQCNCAVLGDENTREALVIDPGDEVARILEVLKRHNLKLKTIVNTHTHIDHVGANEPLRQETGAEVLIHKADQFLLEHLKMQALLIGVSAPPSSKADSFVTTGDSIRCGEIQLGVLHTPGHTPGSLTLESKMEIITSPNNPLFEIPPSPDERKVLAAPRQVLFTGDTLFLSSIGRTDLWGGSFETIMKSLAGLMSKYDDDTLVFPGHGPATTIGRERESNPFLQEL
ncbi:MAG: MBL fold metallo-hydrolase [Acidobacteriia bacterium]|nr:MBL fold metallo-hydrolase [Terriglobia bacterium]